MLLPFCRFRIEVTLFYIFSYLLLLFLTKSCRLTFSLSLLYTYSFPRYIWVVREGNLWVGIELVWLNKRKVWSCVFIRCDGFLLLYLSLPHFCHSGWFVIICTLFLLNELCIVCLKLIWFRTFDPTDLGALQVPSLV